MGLFGKIFGDQNEKLLRNYEARVKEINALGDAFSRLSDEELKGKTAEFKKRLESGETLDSLLPEAFATVREAATRTLGQRHYDVQLIGGMVLHDGKISEMRTGEGKTLVATLPVYLNALSGKGVHVVTVNDYLARRDSVWMGQIYSFLGLTVGVINSQSQAYLYDPGHISKEKSEEADKERDTEGSFKIVYEFLRPAKKSEAYRADITYGTNNEYGFDYLRDNISYRLEDLSQRSLKDGESYVNAGLNFAIIDEVDSILIDEARTPLIISMPTREKEDLYTTFAGIARTLEEGKDYEVDEKFHAVTLTDSGIEKAEKALGIENIYTDAGIRHVHHLETAVRAKAMYQKDKEYVIRDGQIIIVDEFTGRLQPGRRWSEGLHQAIEAKEGVSIQEESRTYASITFQNYFRLYKKIAGMTGTALTSAEEFYKVYGLETLSIPPHRPVARKDNNDLIFRTENGKLTAVTKKIKEIHEKGQPVLVGTVSVEKNEELSEYLTQAGVPHEILNAKNHEREGEIIAQAGKKGAVTVATNLAGRGVDIKLGGATATKEEYEDVRSRGGLYVIGTERHEARRIDNQLRGRSGRQGDPGASEFFVCLEDKLMRVFATDMLEKMMGRLNMPEDEAIYNPLITRSLETAQTKIEGLNFDARKRVLEYDDVLNTQRQSIYERRRKILLGNDDEVEAVLLGLLEGDSTSIEEKKEKLGKEEFGKVVRRLLLQAIDFYWIQHLEVMDYLRGSVSLRAYGQRDPLIEYRKEGLTLFRELEESIASRVRELFSTLGEGAFKDEESRIVKEREQLKRLVTDASSGISKPVEKKIGRNDLVKISNGKEVQEMKFKKAEPLIESGEWKLVV